MTALRYSADALALMGWVCGAAIALSFIDPHVEGWIAYILATII